MVKMVNKINKIMKNYLKICFSHKNQKNRSLKKIAKRKMCKRSNLEKPD